MEKSERVNEGDRERETTHYFDSFNRRNKPVDRKFLQDLMMNMCLIHISNVNLTRLSTEIYYDMSTCARSTIIYTYINRRRRNVLVLINQNENIFHFFFFLMTILQNFLHQQSKKKYEQTSSAITNNWFPSLRPTCNYFSTKKRSLSSFLFIVATKNKNLSSEPCLCLPTQNCWCRM